MLERIGGYYQEFLMVNVMVRQTLPKRWRQIDRKLAHGGLGQKRCSTLQRWGCYLGLTNVTKLGIEEEVYTLDRLEPADKCTLIYSTRSKVCGQ